jgi:hypothetical protein
MNTILIFTISGFCIVVIIIMDKGLHFVISAFPTKCVHVVISSYIQIGVNIAIKIGMNTRVYIATCHDQSVPYNHSHRHMQMGPCSDEYVHDQQVYVPVMVFCKVFIQP